jgi:hypothetical protein
MLDTAHVLPGEILQYIVIAPFLENNAVIVIHDITYELEKNFYQYYPREYMSNMILFSAIFSQYKYISNACIPNIGAIIFNKELSMQTIYFIILIIFKQFFYIPSKEILENTSNIINKYYPKEIADIYEQAIYYSIIRYRHQKYIPFPASTLFHGCKYSSVALPYLDPERDIKFDTRTEAAFQSALRQARSLVSLEDFTDSAPGMFLFPQYSTDEYDCSFEECRQRTEMVRQQASLFPQCKDYEMFLSDRAEQFRGKEVYFFGCGVAYTAFKHIFSDTRPKAILLSMIPAGAGDETLPENVDGIPVCLIQKICHLEPLPIIVFCRTQYQSAVENALKTHLHLNKPENILFCLLNDKLERK